MPLSTSRAARDLNFDAKVSANKSALSYGLYAHPLADFKASIAQEELETYMISLAIFYLRLLPRFSPNNFARIRLMFEKYSLSKTALHSAALVVKSEVPTAACFFAIANNKTVIDR